MHLNETPQLVADTGCETGENPLWHPQRQTLFFLDIPRSHVHGFTPANGGCRLFSQVRTTGGMTLQEDGSLLLFQDGSITVLKMDGTQHLLAEDQCPGNDRFNDVIADAEGRVFAGTLGGEGRLIRYDPDGTKTILLEGLGVPNGMGFTPDLKHLYFTDSVPRLIYRFDYDRSTGDLSNQRVFAEIPEDQGVPDGMTVDADGYVWTAVWFGARLKRYTCDGRLDREVHLPVRQVSALTFGGQDLEDIYVTTAGTHAADSMKPRNLAEPFPRGGGLYMLKLDGVRGVPQFRSDIGFIA
jgi:D-xylono/L-arabinono-1,4-lactonase